ncbi:hypothetical protein AB833_17560 [Chromatiales bacterium (ex Bugula neritina AB1)]|nr:hypothetical protein AB833_17560 [Chromatiales bacterium (ex Bugula neritina AB1)]
MVAASVFALSSAKANDSALKTFAEEKLQAILSDSIVVDSIKAQNEAHSNLDQSQIDSLDLQWRAEVDGQSGDLIEKTLASPLSDYLLAALEEGEGLYTEIFVMDNRGLNVGQSGLTSDYWQGDESKWQETFLVGGNAIHTSDIEFDESSQTYQLQVSISVVDPDSNAVIGAATFGVNAEALQMISLDDLN